MEEPRSMKETQAAILEWGYKEHGFSISIKKEETMTPKKRKEQKRTEKLNGSDIEKKRK